MGGVFLQTPSITNPTASEIDDTLTPTITASAFVSFGGMTHASTDWQVASDSGFSTIVWESLNDTTNKTSVTTTTLGGGERYVRCRYKSNTGFLSSYSSTVQWTSPWVAGSNLTITSSTNADVNATTTVTFQTGTYRVTVWGAAGGKGAGAGGTGGAGGSVRKTVTYPSPAPVTITIGQGGVGGQRCDPTQPSTPTNCAGPSAGGPGWGAGGASGYFTNPSGTWMGAGGGGSSHFDGTIAAGGGGGNYSISGSWATGGGQASSINPAGFGGGGCGTGGPGGSSGSNGGGGGGGSHVSGGPDSACEAGNGGDNSGSFDDEWNASAGTVANPYSSPAYSRTFGSGNSSAGGGRIEKM